MDAPEDLDAYRAPAASQDFIAVFGRERAALHYIYKKVSVASNNSGAIAIPPAERGVFAFVQGVAGRVDSPVLGGLNPNTTYAALVYYPPRSTEQWQWQFKYCNYQGLGNPALLEGAEIIAPPILFAHTQGGGASAFFGDSELIHSPIAMHLPAGSSMTEHYELNTPVHLPGENYASPIAFREIQPVAGTDCSLPKIGRKIDFEPAVGIAPRSLLGSALLVGDVAPPASRIGCQVPMLSTNRPFQSVLCFGIRTSGGDDCLAIATANTNGSESVVFDIAGGSGFDVYRM